MIIGIDASRAVNESAGIGRYTRHITRELIEIATADEFRLLFTFVRDDGPTGQGNKKRWIADIATHRDNVKTKTVALPGQFKQWLSGQPFWRASRYLPDAAILFAPSFLEATVGERIPQIVTIHDLSHALFPGQRGQGVSRWLTKRNEVIARKATRLIAPSQATKDDLVRLFGIGEEKVTVTPFGVDPYFKVLPHVTRQPFFLFVGTISPRKNLSGIFEAYARLPQGTQDEYTLKVVGAAGWQTGPIFETYRRLQLGDRVEFLGFQDDEQLRTLYNEAAAFLYPSTYEGFGLPILEAMACGCPVITGNLSSMPEVAGEAALLVDPNRPDELAAAMQRIVGDADLWASLGNLGLTRAKEFSWAKTASATLDLIHRVGGER